MNVEPGRLQPYLQQLDQVALSNGSQHAQEYISPEQRRTAYARRLIWWFSRETDLIDMAMAAFEENRTLLGQLLSRVGEWDGRSGITLEDAIWDGFDGLTTLEACMHLWDQTSHLHDALPELRRTREQAPGILANVGLRAPWTGPLMLGAWLRHLAFRRCTPNLLMPEFDLWPAGSRIVTDLTPEVTIASAWDPEMETRAHARRRLVNAIDAGLEIIDTRYATDGFEKFRVRDFDRDVHAAYLRLRWPAEFNWTALGRRITALTGIASSARGVERAVSRVLASLQIEPPRIPPGRPRSRPTRTE